MSKPIVNSAVVVLTFSFALLSHVATLSGANVQKYRAGTVKVSTRGRNVLPYLVSIPDNYLDESAAPENGYPLLIWLHDSRSLIIEGRPLEHQIGPMPAEVRERCLVLAPDFSDTLTAPLSSWAMVSATASRTSALADWGESEARFSNACSMTVFRSAMRFSSLCLGLLVVEFVCS